MGFEVNLRRMSNVIPKLLKMVHACRIHIAMCLRVLQAKGLWLEQHVACHVL